jgi:hypothetical protein
MAFHLPFTGSVTYFCVKEHGAERNADHGQLLIGVTASIVYIDLVGYPVGGNGLLKDFLKVVGIVVVEQTSAYDEPGMIIDDYHAVDTAGFPVFSDVWKVTGIGLPAFAEAVFFKCLTVFEVWIAGGFQVIVLYEPLD